MSLPILRPVVVAEEGVVDTRLTDLLGIECGVRLFAATLRHQPRAFRPVEQR
jgi:hypothetical protein